MKSSAGSKWENVSSISELPEKSNYSARFVQILGQKDMGHRRLSTFIYTVPTVAASRPLPLTAKKRAGQRLLGEVRHIFLLGYLQQCCLFSSSFYIPFIAQRGLHLGADLTKIGAGLLRALQNRLHLRPLFLSQVILRQ